MEGIISGLETWWKNYSFIVLFAVAAFFLSFRMPRRKYFIARVTICAVALWAFSFGMNSFEDFLGSDYFLPVGGGKFVLQYIALALCLIVCFDGTVIAASFCATIGYCVQHISLRVTYVCLMFADEKPFALWFFVQIVIFAAICGMIWFFSIRKQRSAYRNIKVDSPVQLLITVFMVVATIYIEMQFFSPTLGIALGNLLQFEYMLSSLCSVLIIMLEINILSRRQMFDDFRDLQRLLGDERKKYELEKANIDMINLKCHDIRHQLRAAEGKMDAEALRELGETISVYSAQIKTGNEAIDVVLASQGLYCLNHRIKLACMIDGTKLGFIPDHELYALFGNAIENAIHAVEKLDEEKRVISVAEKSMGQFVNISITNYFDGTLTFEEGLPISKRENHGFGTRSMRMIVEKYGGRLTVTAKDDLFVLNMFFPFPANEKK